MSPPLTKLPIPKCRLGEGPLWDSEGNRLLLTDIEGKTIHVMNWESGDCHSILVPQKVGFIALAKNGFALGMEDGVYWIAERTLKQDTIAVNDLHLLHQSMAIPGARFNDGKPGPDGRLYCGSLDVSGCAALFRVADGRAEIVVPQVSVSNGMAWSADTKIMYYCDSFTHRLDAFDFDVNIGIVSNRRVACDFYDLIGIPDGLCIDQDGLLWVAIWGEQAIYRVNPSTGEKERIVEVAGVSNISSCVFAGPKLDTLVITSSVMEDEPNSGHTFCYIVNTIGKAPFVFTHLMQRR